MLCWLLSADPLQPDGDFYRSLYYLPSLVGGSVAVALVWKQLFARKGLFNSVLAGMGLSTINWFGDQKLALYR